MPRPIGWTYSTKRTSVCSAHCLNGKRCKRRTSRSDKCWMHLKKEGLQIKKSNIPEAGLGLFTTIPRQKKDYLTNYKGVKSATKVQGDYVFKNGSTYIDAKYTNSCAGRFINNNRNGNNNSKFSAARRYPVTISATKKIKAGDEITVPYGREYWRG